MIFGEIAIEQKIVQRRIALIRLDDPIEKFRANDAAASPDRGDVAEVQVPLVFACLPHRRSSIPCA